LSRASTSKARFRMCFKRSRPTFKTFLAATTGN
jgi:hypothetical protein